MENIFGILGGAMLAVMLGTIFFLGFVIADGLDFKKYLPIYDRVLGFLVFIVLISLYIFKSECGG